LDRYYNTIDWDLENFESGKTNLKEKFENFNIYD